MRLRLLSSRPGNCSRRELLKAAGLGAAAAMLPRRAWAAPLDARAADGKDLLVHSGNPYNAEPELGKLVQSWITPLEHFYVRNHAPVPNIDADQYTLSIEGLVRTGLKVRLGELGTKFPKADVVATMTCAGNRREEHSAVKPVGGVPWSAGAIGNARWTGVPLANLLLVAGVRPEAKHVWFEGLDEIEKGDGTISFGASIPLDKAMDAGRIPGALVATQMNGKPLTPAHGYPVRTVVPGYIGARSVKWLGRIVVSDKPSPNHYVSGAYRLVTEDTAQQWAEADIIYQYRLNSVTCLPAEKAEVSAGKLTVRGYALAAGAEKSRVEKVEISADGGRRWHAAKLDEKVQPFCWQLWKAGVPVTSATKELIVRATDSAGNRQPQQVAWNYKGYLFNAWHRTPIRVS